jgi:aspartyl-tRNA(Asn)/glutamyl-tRNA(Gln) amidotransferase subunit A
MVNRVNSSSQASANSPVANHSNPANHFAHLPNDHRTVHPTVQQTLSLIRSGKLTAHDNIKQYLDTIAQDNKSINAVLHLNPHALSDAQIVDDKIQKNTAGKLAGLGFIVKSNICVKGLIANCASQTLANYQATYDADVITAIKKEDGIIIGMANQDEFACGSSGETSAFGPTQNPRAPGYIPGGSSSGSAASVSAYFCDIALGSDTGGSIRNPASHCAVYGIKPSYGSVSRYGLIDLSMSLDQIGPLCRDLYGCLLALDVISGQSEHDATTIEKVQPLVSDSGLLMAPQKPLVFATSPDFDSLCVDLRILHAVQDVAKRLDATTVTLPHIDLAIQTYYPLVYVEFFSGTRKFDGRRYAKKIEESCGDEVLRRILGGKEISQSEHQGKYYRAALGVKAQIEKALVGAFEQVDCIILPTTPVLPHKFGEAISVQAMYAYDAFTIPANLAGVSAGVIPLTTIDSVPVGLQVYAKNDVVLAQAMAHIDRILRGSHDTNA